MPAVVVDMDNTLIKRGVINRKVVSYIKDNYKEIIVMTNRSPGYRESTIRELKEMGIKPRMLVMNNTELPSEAWKKKMVKFYLSKGHDIVEFVDDKKENRDAVESIGGIKVTNPADI
jgi:hypothetical protein